MVEGATPLAQWEQLCVQALSEEVLSAGTATIEQLEGHLARLEGPDYREFGWAWIGVHADARPLSEIAGELPHPAFRRRRTLPPQS